MLNILSIAIGGIIGSLMRYGAGGFVHRFAGGNFPYGTLLVNLSGCLAIGFLWGAFERFNFSSPVRSFLFIGVLGSYTTFSSFGLETFNLLRDREFVAGAYNILFTNLTGIAFVFAGYFAASWLVSLGK